MNLSFPLKPLFGTYSILLFFIVAIPLFGFDTDFKDNLSPSASVSFLSASIITLVSYLVWAKSLFAIGVWFSFSLTFSFTLIITFAFASPPLPSLIVYSKLSFPLKPLAGVYLILPSSTFTVPWLGFVVDLIIKLSPSASLSFLSTSIVTAVSYSVTALSSLAFGAVFGFSFTVTATLAFASPPFPSLIV